MIYTRDDFRPVPAEVTAVLEELGSYQFGGPIDRTSGHREVAAALARHNASPYTIIVIEELLDESHMDDNVYVAKTREEIWSEMDETIFREFGDEINSRMAQYLENHADPDNVYLDVLIKEYHPAAMEILRERYQEFYPNTWQRRMNIDHLTRKRVQVRRERRYTMPRPLDFWDHRNSYQQYFVIPELRTLRQGGSGSSGQREVQSMLGFAFCLYARQKSIPTFILVYDKHNWLNYIDRTGDLCLVGYDMGSNYHLDRSEEMDLLGSARKVVYEDPIRGIEKIEVVSFEGNR